MEDLTTQFLVQLALQEDRPKGDCTTDTLPNVDEACHARLIAKQDLVLSGTTPFELSFKTLNSEVSLTWHFSPGELALSSQTLCSLKGPFWAIVGAERVALNFLGHLSGIATLTRLFVNQIKHTSCKILDTRKTTPLLRRLEKQAVLDGHGHNHRMTLSDAILLKENHISHMGGIEAAVVHLQKTQTHKPIEVECSSLEDIRQAVRLNVGRILLDNMSNEMISEALKLIPSHIETEASGNMTLERVASVAELGVNYISIGALTHSAPCADVSLLIEN